MAEETQREAFFVIFLARVEEKPITLVPVRMTQEQIDAFLAYNSFRERVQIEVLHYLLNMPVIGQLMRGRAKIELVKPNESGELTFRVPESGADQMFSGPLNLTWMPTDTPPVVRH